MIKQQIAKLSQLREAVGSHKDCCWGSLFINDLELGVNSVVAKSADDTKLFLGCPWPHLYKGQGFLGLGPYLVG